MFDLVKNTANGIQYVVDFLANAIHHLSKLPEIFSLFAARVSDALSLFPADIAGLLGFSVSLSLILKVVKWNNG